MNIRISAIALACLVGLSFSADPRMEQGARFEAKDDFEMALGEYRAVLAEIREMLPPTLPPRKFA